MVDSNHNRVVNIRVGILSNLSYVLEFLILYYKIREVWRCIYFRKRYFDEVFYQDFVMIVMLFSHTTKLVRFYEGVDGLKTGYTSTAGYCLTFTAKKGNMRLLGVVMGEPESDTRNKEVKEMLDFGFAQYRVETLLSTKSVLGKKAVDKGKERYAELVPTENISFLNKKADAKINATYEMEVKKLKAPLKVGDVVGTLVVKDGENVLKTVDITVKEEIKKANLLELYWRHLKDILTGNIQF